MSNNNHFREDNLHSFGECVNPGGKIYRKNNQTGCSSMSDNLYKVPAFKDNCIYKEKKNSFLKFIIELYSLLNAKGRLSVRICFNTYHNTRLKAYIFVLGAWETGKQKDWNKFYFPISATPEWGNVISRDNNTFKWLGIYLVPKIIWEDWQHFKQ